MSAGSLDAVSTITAAQESQYADTPEGWRQRWLMELKAAKEEHDDWQKKGQDIVDRFLDKRKGAKSMPQGIEVRWNIYTASVQTKRAMLYGKPPTVDVRNKFSDTPDGVARLAGEIGERLLNSDIERDEDGFKEALDNALMDRLNPGLAFIRFRYVADWEEVEGKDAILNEDGTEAAPAVEPYSIKTREEVETDYVFWKDVLWSPCRTFREKRWCAFLNRMAEADVKKAFGEDVSKKIAYNTKKDDSNSDAGKNDPWKRADVWEIWDKEHKCVWFYAEGYQRVLKRVDLDDASWNANGSLKDPLGLKNFWPFGKPMLANVTSSAFVPRADFTLNQDLLDEIDRVTTRITELQRAIGAKGVYDKNATDSLGRILTESSNNQMFPVENWGAFREKGGIASAMELLPIDGMVAALDKLRDYRQELVTQYYQTSGDSDLARGQQLENGTPGEAQVKAKFASVRLQAMQDEFARFASDAQAVRLEIVAKHFDANTIVERSNIAHSFDADNPLLQQAVELLKSDTSCYRVEVKPENVSMDDFAQQRAERTEVISSIATFLQTAAPAAAMLPGSTPYLLKMLQWMVGGLRGASTIQGVLDQAIAHAEEAAAQQQAAGPTPQQPDPKLIANQQKAQADQAKIQATTQSELMRMQAETQALAQRKATDAIINVKEAQAKQHIAHGGIGMMPQGPGGM